ELGLAGDNELAHRGGAGGGQSPRATARHGQTIHVPPDHADPAGGIDDPHRSIGGEGPALVKPVVIGRRLERQHEPEPSDVSLHVAARVAQRSSSTFCRATAANSPRSSTLPGSRASASRDSRMAASITPRLRSSNATVAGSRRPRSVAKAAASSPVACWYSAS